MNLDADAVVWTHATTRQSAPSRPLLVLMHGLGSHEHDLVGLLPHLPSHVDAASLRAPLRDMGGFAWFPRGDSAGTPDGQAIAQAAQAVLSWLDASVDATTPVIPVGFSQGGAMVTQLLRERPTRFAAGVVLSGFRHSAPHPHDAELAEQHIPVFCGRGDSDPIITTDRFFDLEHWLEQHTDVDLHVYAGMPHAVNAEELRDLSDFITRVCPVTEVNGSSPDLS